MNLFKQHYHELAITYSYGTYIKLVLLSWALGSTISILKSNLLCYNVLKFNTLSLVLYSWVRNSPITVADDLKRQLCQSVPEPHC